MRTWISQHRHIYWLLYFPIYLLIFELLEHHEAANPYTLTSALDRCIPFCKWFIIPYLLWFAYNTAVIADTFFHNVPEFHRLMRFLCAGMTVFLLVSAICPTQLNLRPALSDDGSLCTRLVMFLYQIDTPTNVFPSIHVFNSVGCLIAVCRSHPERRPLRAGSFVLTVLIILSTLLLKQHSIVDVIGGLILAAVLYDRVYAPQRLRRGQRQLLWPRSE